MTFARFARTLEARRGRHGVVILAVTGSTNDLAKRIVRDYTREDDSPPALDIVAWHQESGRGRDQRTWMGGPGAGVYASMVRPLTDARASSTLPVAVAVGLARALNRHIDDRCRLKWPNDLLVEGRKLGGVLIEVVGCGGGGCGGAVIGFGINHRRDWVEEPSLRATSVLAESATEVDLSTLTADLLESVDACLAEPFDELLAAYRDLSTHKDGDQLSLRGVERPVEGTFRGFDDRGFLRLAGDDGAERTFAAGELDR